MAHMELLWFGAWKLAYNFSLEKVRDEMVVANRNNSRKQR